MRYYLIFILLLASYSIFSQTPAEKEAFEENTQPGDSALLIAEFDNLNFFKNNEYFNPFVEGYSLIGFSFNPYLTYKISSTTQVSGGMHLLKYSGISKFTKTEPLFRVKQTLFDGLDLIMGSIYNNNNHNLIDPLYHHEKVLTDPLESGIQFRFNKKYLDLDIWLNWKKFIFENSPFQEEFQVGAYISPVIFKNKKTEVLLPIQFLAEHKGGQIDTSSKPMQSALNFAIGPKISVNLPAFFHKITFESFYTGFRDISPEKGMKYARGIANYTCIQLINKSWNLGFSYWYSEKFVPIAGNPLYSSISEKTAGSSKARELLGGNLRYKKHFKETVFSAGMDLYYDPANNNLDYSFGIYLLVRPQFIITRF